MTYSTETYGDESNVKPVIGDDVKEREGEREQEWKTHTDVSEELL